MLKTIKVFKLQSQFRISKLKERGEFRMIHFRMDRTKVRMYNQTFLNCRGICQRNAKKSLCYINLTSLRTKMSSKSGSKSKELTPLSLFSECAKKEKECFSKGAKKLKAGAKNTSAADAKKLKALEDKLKKQREDATNKLKAQKEKDAAKLEAAKKEAGAKLNAAKEELKIKGGKGTGKEKASAVKKVKADLKSELEKIKKKEAKATKSAEKLATKSASKAASKAD